VEEEGNHVLVGGDPRRGRKREKRSESRGFAARLEQKWRFTIRLSYDDDDENDKYFVTSILTTSSPRFTTAPFRPNKPSRAGQVRIDCTCTRSVVYTSIFVRKRPHSAFSPDFRWDVLG
jgi:hypothetical protein